MVEATETAEDFSSTPSSDLTTTLHLLVLPSIFAVLSGALLLYSVFFGASLAAVFLCSVLYALYRIGTPKQVTVKLLEVALLGAAVPLIAVLCVVSTLYFPEASFAMNMLLIAIAMPHRALLRIASEQLNTPFLLGYSFVLLIASVIGTGFICAQWGWYPRYGVPNVFPTCLVLIYALGPLLDNTFQLRDKLPISAMESAALFMSFLGVIGCIASNFYLPDLLPGSILATLVCALLYVRLDYLEHQMRTPHEQWTSQTASDAYRHTAIKVFPLLTIAAWAGMGAYGSWAIKEDVAERAAKCGANGTAGRDGCVRGTQFLGTPIFSSLAVLGHVAIAGAVLAMRERANCCRLFCPHVTLPAWVAMTIVGSLYLLVTILLDGMRACLLPYNASLLMASIGLGIYLVITGGYLYSPADAPPYLAVFLTGVLVCTLLVVHFAMDKKKEQMKKDPTYFTNDGELSVLFESTDATETATETQD